MQNKRQDGKQQSSQWKKGLAVNQVDADESDPGSSSEASVSLINQIQGQVAHIKFVKNKNNTTAIHGDPCKLPKLKIRYNLSRKFKTLENSQCWLF